MKKQFEQYEYLCNECNKKFRVDRLAGRDYVYGEFLLRSQNLDNIIYLDAISDSVFNYLSSLLDNIVGFGKDDWRTKAETLHYIFGFTCDPDIDGGLYKMNLKPKCHYCGLRNTIIIKPVEPIKIFEMDIPEVEHKIWNKLSTFEKRELIEKVLKDLKT